MKKIGLIGTGIWAREVHAPAIQNTDGVELVSVFGRDAPKVDGFAAHCEAEAFFDLEAFLDSVDLVGIAVPPLAQARFALAAARAGKPTIMEKPLAPDLKSADEIADAFASMGTPNAVFFTRLFMPEVAAWITQSQNVGTWLFGRCESFSTALADPGSAYFGSSWREKAGALWDSGPHAISLLCAVLGPVQWVSAMSGNDGMTVLSLTHESGAISISTQTIMALTTLPGSIAFFGSDGMITPPGVSDWNAAARDAYSRVVSELARGQPTSWDAEFAAHVTRVLVAAEMSVASNKRINTFDI